ncbi:MAG: hypothetical protein PS018_20900 [bacterium]|nr:hypothetical protein [bacterium]
MPFILRAPVVEELPALSALCLRSKAVRGYDALMEACREANLCKLLVELAALRGGVGKALFLWAVSRAKVEGAAFSLREPVSTSLENAPGCRMARPRQARTGRLCIGSAKRIIVMASIADVPLMQPD